MKKLTQDEIKTIQIEILKVVSEYCENENLRYFLAYGTLLGAVRHKGYIPWDDDIDILMPRNDYERFIKYFNKQNKIYRAYSCSNDPVYPWPYAKISYEKTLLVEKLDIRFDKLGVNIDIFPIDGLPESKNEQNKILNKIKMMRKILNLKYIAISSGRMLYKNAILLLGKIIFSFINYRKIVGSINRQATMYSYKDSKYVACLVWNYGCKEVMPKSIFSKQCELVFEGRKYKAPIGYHENLVKIYGNYMRLPKMEDRRTHHNFKAYWK